MIDRGYKKITLITFPNGLYTEAPHAAGTAAQSLKSDEDYSECYGDVASIIQIYGVQQGNPAFYSDVNEAVADCFRRENKVPSSYSASDLRKESEKHSYSFFEEKDAIFRGCKVANGWHNSYDDDTRVDLWEQ